MISFVDEFTQQDSVSNVPRLDWPIIVTYEMTPAFIGRQSSRSSFGLLPQ